MRTRSTACSRWSTRRVGSEPPDWSSRIHFFAVAARHMRQILVDHARHHRADKRGGGERPLTLDEGLIATDRPEELVALDDGLAALAAVDERKSRVIEMLHFGGMTQAEIAAVLDVHVNTVARDLKLGEAWLHRHLKDST